MICAFAIGGKKKKNVARGKAARRSFEGSRSAHPAAYETFV